MRPDVSNAVSKARRGRASTPALGVSDATFRALIENSNDAIVLFDSDWKAAYASAATERILGYTPAEIIGTEGLALVHPDDLTQAKGTIEACLENPGRPVR